MLVKIGRGAGQRVCGGAVDAGSEDDKWKQAPAGRMEMHSMILFGLTGCILASPTSCMGASLCVCLAVRVLQSVVTSEVDCRKEQMTR